MRSIAVSLLLTALAVPATATTFNYRLGFMERFTIDTQNSLYEGWTWNDPSTPEPYYVEGNIPVTGFDFNIRLKNGRGTVEVSIDGYQDSTFNIRSLDREPFEGFFYYVSPEEIIRKERYDPKFLDGGGWNVSWQSFQFVATPRGKTEIFPYGFVFYGDLGDWGENYTTPRYQSSYYFSDVTPFAAPVPVPVPASLPMLFGGIAAFAMISIVERRRPGALPS